MPQGQPTVGELWTNTGLDGREVSAVIGEVGNVITLVSMTGNRIRVSPDRLGGWQYRNPRPRTRHNCGTHACYERAVFEMQPVQTGLSYRCPWHLPVGRAAWLLRDDPEAPLLEDHLMTEDAVPLVCPLCQRDRLVERAIPGVRISTEYHCEGCNTRMTYFECAADRNIGTVLGVITNDVADRDRRPPNFQLVVGMRVYNQIQTHNNGYAGLNPESVVTFQNIRFDRSAEIPEWGSFLIHTRGLPVPLGAPGVPVFEQRATPLLVPPLLNSQWVMAQTGSLVTVTRVSPTSVHFRGTTEHSSVAMTLEDFYQYHRMVEARPKQVDFDIDINPGEEWDTQPGGVHGQMVKILKVDRILGIVGIEESDGTMRSVRLADVVHGRWEKVVRRSAFDRLIANTDFD